MLIAQKAENWELSGRGKSVLSAGICSSWGGGRAGDLGKASRDHVFTGWVLLDKPQGLGGGKKGRMEEKQEKRQVNKGTGGSSTGQKEDGRRQKQMK